MEDSGFSTGLAELDHMLRGILPGDNIVWKIDTIEDYRHLVAPFVEAAIESGRPIIYFRFANHPALVDPHPGVRTLTFQPQEGFEPFVEEMHECIAETGRGAYYIFDCLSDLADAWYSDVMLGNFFTITCPYIFDMEAIAYFAILRNHHSAFAIDPISKTTQIVLDVYHHKHYYIRPTKAQSRYCSTMNMLHRWDRSRNQLTPISDSVVIAEIMTSAQWSGLDIDRRPGFWQRAFIDAQEVLDEVHAGRRPPADEQASFERLVPMVITRDQGMQDLVHRYLSLKDILAVRRRMIGSGLIGGKAVGMLLARAIIKQTQPEMAAQLEAHDSFFIGSDIFYTYLVRNGIWGTRSQQRHSSDAYLEYATRARRLIITGSFSEARIRQFQEMIDYFGQSPFIVRSSSLLEDNFGNAFAGKYESVFCANQGPQSQRLEDFLSAVRTIYASTMSERALRYRERRGMLDQDEQMALLVMRVSGRAFGKNFYPPIAGVGFSFNPYVWSPEIDPCAGVVRLVFGLGTRAVDRSDDDYTRLVALNAPDRRPEHSFDEVKQYAQRRVDTIDLEANHLTSCYFQDLIETCAPLPMDLATSIDTEQQRIARSQGHPKPSTPPRVLTFDKLLKTDFVDTLRTMMQVLQEAYHHPVDIEFTTNFDEDGAYRINLVQCRPLQVQGTEATVMPSVDIPKKDRIISARSAVIGQSRLVDVGTFIYVAPNIYGALQISERHDIARLLGKVNRALKKRDDAGLIVLLGPGRWGTSSPSLGIPVSFADINGVSILCEIVAMRKDLIPDVSLGTHFLNELVEMDMLYLALFPGKECSFLDEERFLQGPSILLDLVPSAEKWKDAVRVLPAAALAGNQRYVTLTANAMRQEVDCFLSDVSAQELIVSDE